ncbi:MAG TPA: hypothetical protein VJ822_17205, partial [Dongiaceae bacterium]|nr:hypothetical protein [Dongiaceae bacterium]
MVDLLARLKRNAQRGSKPRCHMLTHGAPDEVAARLTALAAPFATVAASDRWMPVGFEDVEEAQLHSALRLLDAAICARLRDWWLAPASVRAMTPNFDIASTCTVEGRPGMLLIEAKAHDDELLKETVGRLLEPDALEDRVASHGKIGEAIAGACRGLCAETDLPWKISRDACYQMSNRFAWSWKLTECGFPVVLIYLGFLRANEMDDRGKPFADEAEWKRLVQRQSAPLFPPEIWGQRWEAHGVAFVPLIRGLEVSLPST